MVADCSFTSWKSEVKDNTYFSFLQSFLCACIGFSNFGDFLLLLAWTFGQFSSGPLLIMIYYAMAMMIEGSATVVQADAKLSADTFGIQELALFAQIPTETAMWQVKFARRVLEGAIHVMRLHSRLELSFRVQVGYSPVGVTRLSIGLPVCSPGSLKIS